ncbi:MAG TPA: CPBP family intramembrane glutamic endopeptidase [Acetobacteraceae bacterium]|nr:CPBP family intramembrane glutamic endopeptidase [Acetobacteraceae bacterium]
MTGDTPPVPAGAWRVLRRAVLWLLAAEFAAWAASFVIVFCLVVARSVADRHAAPGWVPPPLAYALPGTVALQATLLFADLRQGRIFGRGSLAAGLGAGPVQRRRLIALLVVLMIASVLTYIIVLTRFQSVANFIARDATPTPVLAMTGGPALIVVRVLLIAFLAPIAEELFFRGWFWTALRRYWSVWPTALCTGGIWLALHALEGAVRVPILLPAAILLSLARHYGGSVRASIPLHIANNLTAVAIQIAAVMAGP